jgi:hypothetical protein
MPLAKEPFFASYDADNLRILEYRYDGDLVTVETYSCRVVFGLHAAFATLTDGAMHDVLWQPIA